MKIFKITNKDKTYIVKAVDSYTAIHRLHSSLKDERLSPMTYKKLKELGYNSNTWKDLSQEEANKIVSAGKQANSGKSNTQETKEPESTSSTTEKSKPIESTHNEPSEFNKTHMWVPGRGTGTWIPVSELKRTPDFGYTGEYKDRSDISTVNIPKDPKLKSIYREAFMFSKGLTHITIPDNIERIGDSAFANCYNLKEVTIGKNVNEVGGRDFRYCNISTIKVNNSPYFTNSGNCLIGRSSGRLILGTNNSVIPDDGSVKTIDEYAFSGRKELKSISIPDSINRIERATFNDCTGLKTVKLSNNLKTISSSAFKNCESLQDIELPQSIKLIDIGAFQGCKQLKNVDIPDNTKVKDSAFAYCTNLESVKLPNNSNTTIPSYMFAGCKKLPDISIPDGYTDIDYNAMSYCESLKDITLPASISNIKKEAFLNCSNLKNIYFKGTVEQWQSIKKSKGWDRGAGKYTVHCSDGELNS